jgi:serine/threonine protein kinase
MKGPPAPLRPRSRLGKYRILGRLAMGGFADVYRALDTVEGGPVALKIPPDGTAPDTLDLFRREIRLAATLEHPHILPLKNADVIEGRLVVAYPLGIESLADRFTRRLGFETVLSFADQLLEALAYAHHRRIVHCDVKPENVILFPEGRLRLGDFGLARVALRTLLASGSGTLGYMAPEQAMGRPSFRSDVFSAGLILYRMLAGKWPAWPFTWPLPGHADLVRRAAPGLVALVRRALQVDPERRFPDAGALHARFRRLVPASRRWARQRRRRHRR